MPCWRNWFRGGTSPFNGEFRSLRVRNNQILPVTAYPNEFDYLEIRPKRRIRVVHRLGNPHRRGITLSRDEGDGRTDSDDEQYWFENAAPKRPGINPAPKKPSSNRIINKFGPQNSPRSQLKYLTNLAATGRKESGESDADVSSINDDSRSPLKKLPRKKINPDDQRISDEEDDDLGNNETKKNEKQNCDRFNTDSLKNDHSLDQQEISPKAKGVDLRNDATNFDVDNDSVLEMSPKTKSKFVHSEPNPDRYDETALRSEAVEVIVEGSNLGGRANVGYIENEDDESLRKKEDGNTNQGEEVHDKHLSSEGERRQDKLAHRVKPVLFFIHGVGGSANLWNAQLDFFVNLGYEVVAPDLIGHGFSSQPRSRKSYTFAKIFRDLLIIFDHYIPITSDINRRCVIAAHSYGCAFATALTRARPNNIKMLILVASGGPSPLTPSMELSTNKRFTTLSVVLERCCVQPCLNCCCRRIKQDGTKMRDKAKGNLRGKSFKVEKAFDIPRYVFKYVMEGQYWPDGDAGFHRRILLPTLLVYGLKDNYVSLVEMCEMERTIPKSYLELIPLAGHLPMLEQPKELNVMMKRFVEKYTLKNS